MNRVKNLAALAILVLVLLVLVSMLACQEGEAPLPTGSTALEPLTLGGNLPVGSEEEAVSAIWETSNDGETWFVQMQNTSFDFTFNAACYVDGDAPVAEQRVVKPFSSKLVRRGKSATLEAALECGRVHQCDFFSGNGVPLSNPDLGGRLLQAKRVVAGDCPKKEGCVAPPEPQCEFGPPTYDPATCTWKCPPPQVCEPPGEPPDCCVDNPACKPPPKKECKCVSEWNYETCKWDQECVCECPKVDEPPCGEFCEFDEETCSWECDYPTCDPGFEFSLRTCECKAVKICHVSNKGRDGDWNLQEQTVNATPGHLKHLDINEFCPPDYLGVCDGRSASWTPDMCQQ